MNPSTNVRCLADSPDLSPWWVKREGQCNSTERVGEEEKLWGRKADASCLKRVKQSGNSTARALSCGLWSNYWQDISSPLFLIGSQLDPATFASQPCLPLDSSKEIGEYEEAWRAGMVALYEAVAASAPKNGLFLPSCSVHAFLSGGPQEAYFSQLEVPLIDTNGTESATLASMLEDWEGGKKSRQGIDAAGSRNPGCASPAPHLASHQVSAGLGHATRTRLTSRLSPPYSLFPAGYSRLCSLDRTVAGCGLARSVLVQLGPQYKRPRAPENNRRVQVRNWRLLQRSSSSRHGSLRRCCTGLLQKGTALEKVFFQINFTRSK